MCVARSHADRRADRRAQLHQLMPAVITCLVGKPLCADPATEDHWSLRELAAGIIGTICQYALSALPAASHCH